MKWIDKIMGWFGYYRPPVNPEAVELDVDHWDYYVADKDRVEMQLWLKNNSALLEISLMWDGAKETADNEEWIEEYRDGQHSGDFPYWVNDDVVREFLSQAYKHFKNK